MGFVGCGRRHSFASEMMKGEWVAVLAERDEDVAVAVAVGDVKARLVERCCCCDCCCVVGVEVGTVAQSLFFDL